MGDQTLILSALGEDDSVWAGAASRVGFVAAQDGEFLVWARVWEGEALVVVVLMRVAVRVVTGLVVRVPLVEGLVDVGLVVAGGSACFHA